MTEPPRPPGDGNYNDPTQPGNPYAANEPGSGSAPPPYGYQQQPGYQQPPGYGQQPNYGQAPQTDDRTWLLIAHFGGAAGAFIGGGVLGWVAPLIAMTSRGPQSPYVRAEAVKALNFQLLWSLITLVCWVLACAVIGAFLAPIAMLIAIIIGVVAGVKAANGEPYTYPMSYPFIK